MAVRVYVATYLRPFTGGKSEITLPGSPATVAQVLEALAALHRGVRERVITEQGEVRPHVNLFVGEENIRDARGLETEVPDGIEISILPAVSGG